jgi:hypothetical protein
MMGLYRFLTHLPWRVRAAVENRVCSGRFRHELAVCAIFREEAPFLDEWLTFHSGVGVTHFYLYNNYSTDEFRAVLAPWIARGVVTLQEWPRKVGQLGAYRHCVRHYRRRARWIAFIDADEFLFSPQAVDIRPVLRGYDDVPGVLVWGMFFGANGHERRPAQPLTDAFVRRASPAVVRSGKTIANPRMIYAIRSPHVFKFTEGEAVDTSWRPQRLGQDAPVFDLLRYNHYWSRSIEDLKTKVGAGDASTPQARDLAWHLEFEAQLNAEEDRAIVPIAAAIRAGKRGA